MNGFRQRILGPLAMPVTGLLVGAAVIFSLSRVLLGIEERQSPAATALLGIAIAVVVLLAGGYFAFDKGGNRTRGTVGVAGLLVVILFGGGYAWGLSHGEGGEGGEGGHGKEKAGAGEGAAESGGGTLDVVIKDFAFAATELTVPAGAVEVNLDNQDVAKHNFTVEGVDGLPAVAAGAAEKATGKGKLAAGSYTFFCSEPGHRGAGMEGKLTVTGGGASAEGGDAHGGGGGAGGTLDVVTDLLAFNATELTVPAGEVTVNLDNKDGADHTFTLEGVPGFKEVVAAAGTKATGKGKLTAGTFTFFCSKPGHRSVMEGTLTVK